MKRYTQFFRYSSVHMFMALCSILFLLTSACEKNLEKTNPVVITCGSIPVFYKEYRFFLKQEMAMTRNHFYVNYGASSGDKFWSTVYGGITPLQYIKQKTNENLFHNKAIQELSIQNGLIKEFDYDTLLEECKTHILKRKKDFEEHKIVYGKVDMSFNDYYGYWFSNLELNLKEVLETKYHCGEKELKALYNKVKQDKFQYRDQVDIAYFYIDNVLYANQATKDALQFLVKKMRKDSLEVSASLIEGMSFIEYGEKTYKNTERFYGEENPDVFLKNEAMPMKKHQIKQLQLQDGVYFIQLLEASKPKIKHFGDVADELRKTCTAEQYRKIMDSLKSNLPIVYNHSVYDTITEATLYAPNRF